MNHIDISECSNSDYESRCSWYYVFPEECGHYDAEDFKANEICCACKLGFKLYRIMILIDWKFVAIFYILIALCILADVNECTANTHNCHPNADCTNTNGGFTCACKSGFSGSGTSCDGKKWSYNSFDLFWY